MERRVRGRRPLAALFSSILALALGAAAPASAADQGDFVAYITYSPDDIATSVSFAGGNLSYLREVASLLAMGDSTLLRRVDSSHWAAITRLGSGWLLQIHDEDADYNFRALVDPASGRVTVRRGVDYLGTGRELDAARVARAAVDFIGRLRSEAGAFTGARAEKSVAPVSAAWKRLEEGNLRWSQGRPLHPSQDAARLSATAKGQHPFAVVLTCSDSRLPPELIFDQGIGDLFVVRTAGEVAGPLELGSIEYAVEHLGAGLVLVLGHSRCGAVDATIKGGELPPDIEAIASLIRPAVNRVAARPGDLLDNAVRENARLIALSVAESPLLAEAIEEGRLSVMAAYYDLDHGEVTALR